MDTEDTRNWAGLLPELIQVIAKKIADISDFISFRAVCTTWRLLTSVGDLSLQFPWILCNCDGPDLLFYSIAIDKYFVIHSPKFLNKSFFRPYGGYMFARLKNLSHDEMSLVNPLTESKISLPPLNCLYHDWMGSRNFQSGDYLVFKGFHTSTLCICKPGDERWVHWEMTDDDDEDDFFLEFLGERNVNNNYYYLISNNLLFIIDDSLHKSTKVIDITTCETIYVVPPPQDSSVLLTNKNRYPAPHPILIESSGEVLNITYISDLQKFEIYQLEFGSGNENPHWSKTMSIGDRMLFIDLHNCYGYCIQAADFGGFSLKGNCIYYIRRHKKVSHFSHYFNIVERYDVESGTIEHIHSKEGEELTWFLPSLNQL